MEIQLKNLFNDNVNRMNTYAYLGTLYFPGMSHFCRPKWHNHLIARAAAQLIKSLHNSSTTRLGAAKDEGLAFGSLISWPVIFTHLPWRAPGTQDRAHHPLPIHPMMVTRGKRLTCHLTNQTTQLLGDSDQHIASWVKPPSYRILSFHILALISVDLVCCMLHFSSLFLFLTSQSILRISTLDAAKLAMCRGDWGRKSRCGS